MALLDNHKHNDNSPTKYEQTLMIVGLHKPSRPYNTDTTETRNTQFPTSLLRR